MVQIRSLDDHKMLPGLEVGELGSKLGYNVMDNGYLSFDNCRIRRTDMLSRFVHIDKDGSFELKGDPRTLYKIMVQARILIICGGAYYLIRSLIISVRYAVCRRQFKTISGKKEERKLLDYQSHMAVLGPNLANCLVLALSSRMIKNLSYKATNEIMNKNSFKTLDVLHHFTSGMKAIATDYSYRGIDEMR